MNLNSKSWTKGSDVDDNFMMINLWWWPIECCWQNHLVGDLFRYAGDFGYTHLNLVSNIFYLSPAYLVSNIHHQHRCNRCALKFLLIISKLSNYKKPKSILLTEWKYISKFKPVQRILHFGVVARTIGQFHRFLRFRQFWTIIQNVSDFLSRGNFDSKFSNLGKMSKNDFQFRKLLGKSIWIFGIEFVSWLIGRTKLVIANKSYDYNKYYHKGKVSRLLCRIKNLCLDPMLFFLTDESQHLPEHFKISAE